MGFYIIFNVIKKYFMGWSIQYSLLVMIAKLQLSLIGVYHTVGYLVVFINVFMININSPFYVILSIIRTMKYNNLLNKFIKNIEYLVSYYYLKLYYNNSIIFRIYVHIIIYIIYYYEIYDLLNMLTFL